MNIKNTVIILLVAVFAIAAGSYFSTMKKQAEREDAAEAAHAKYSNVQGNVLNPVRKITVPSLQQHDGKPFTGEDLQKHWSILFFGFTHCSEICPTTMSLLAQAKKMAEEQNVEFPKVYLVSVDPERDDAGSLGKFVGGFDKEFTGVTGDPKLIKALSLQMSVIYMPAEPGKTDSGKDDGKGYQIDHSAALLLMNPEGNLVAFLNPPHTAEKILKDTRFIIDSAE
jgi:protein SCO1/2